MSSLTPRVVFVTRESEYELLMQRHATREQGRFFLSRRGRTLESTQSQHDQLQSSHVVARACVPDTWRQASVRRADLDRFLFGSDDIIVALGQDGLVANVAKYLNGQPVIGVNPMPDLFDGILVRTSLAHLGHALERAVAMDGFEARTMAEAQLDTGASLVALNELFIGHKSHQSARYVISDATQSEQHSSSGIIVATGTGATGWARSIMEATSNTLPLSPVEEGLVYFVREAFPSISTKTNMQSGIIDSEPLQVSSKMNDGGVIFADGIERDFLAFDWGMNVSISTSSRKLMLALA
jgi:NAD kinase